MQMPLPLPKRKINSNSKAHHTYKLKDFVGKDDEYIKNSRTGKILVNHEDVINHLDLLRKIIALREISQINCLDYESAVYLENNLEENITLSLVDDYQNKDRSYIDTTAFKKHKFYIPLSYIMWNPIIGDACNVHCLRYIEYDIMTSMNGDKSIDKKTILKIKQVIETIYMENLTDVDKCILVSNYLQSTVQYVEDGFESHADHTYVIKAKEEEVTIDKVASINSVVEENYGLCIAIANTTTLLLNNPTFNVNIRSIYGDSHVWNIVTIDGKKYFIDNTWAITRNKNRVKEALKATSFSNEYLLFGSDKAQSIGHHNPMCYTGGTIEKEDYSQESISERKRILSKKISFTDYGKKLRFESRIKEEK